MFDFSFNINLNVDESKINQLIEGQEEIMTTLEEAIQKEQQLFDAIAAEQAQVQGMLQDLRDQIIVLQGQVNNGGIITQPEFDEFVSQLDTAIARVQGISEAVVTPPTPTEQAPTEPTPEEPTA